MDNIETYNNIKILSGPNTHPGSGDLKQHNREINLFQGILTNVTSDKPLMIELGSFWALWSLLFRSKFPDGENILVDVGKKQLEVGISNFELNNFTVKAYHGGFFLNESNTITNKNNDIDYDAKDGETFVGPEISIKLIFEDNVITKVDVMHMDIQGSEAKLLKELIDNDFIAMIDNIVIATHSPEIHKYIIKELENTHSILINEPFGSIGGDGYIYGKNNINTSA